MATHLAKTVLVSGGNRRIGQEICRQLAAKGFTVFLGSRTKKKGEAAAANMKGDVRVVALDVSDEQSIRAAYAEISSAATKLDALVNNAAILIASSKSLLDVTAAELDQTMTINFRGPWLLTQVFSPLLEKGSRVIMISSGAGQMDKGIGGYAPLYSLSKSTLNALTRHLSASFRSKGVVVNAVGPGWVQTDMGGTAATRSVDKGAETPVWLATEAPLSVNDMFLRDKQESGW